MKKIKKYMMVISPFIVLFFLFCFLRSHFSAPNSDNSGDFNKKVEFSKIDNATNKHPLKKKNSIGRLVKLHLLTPKEIGERISKESRNIFLVSKMSIKGEDEVTTDANTIDKNKTSESIEIQIPQFPYVVIGSIKMYESSDFIEFAVIFNGYENLFVKEGDMIDSFFQLIKINEDDVDIKYLGNEGMIKVEIKGR